MSDLLQPRAADKDSKDHDTSDRPKKCKYLGLSNQGATCYMNSLLQSLFMTPEFRNGIYTWHYSDKEVVRPEDCIPLQLQILFAKLQTFKDQDYLDTKSLIKSFQWDSEESFKQHDVQEFSAVLFDAIEESFRGSDQEYFIRDLYQGICLGYVKCRKCNNESLNEDRFLYLSLIVKDDFEKVYNPTVDKGLENYLKPFILEGDNKYFCDKCQEKVEAEKGVKLATLPKILTIHLNRFDMDYTTMMRKKLNNKVTFPFVLNMNKFLKPYEEIAKENSKDPQNKTIDIIDSKDTPPNIADQELWLNYQTEAFKLSQKKRGIKKPAVTFEDYEGFLSKKVISPMAKNNNSGLNLMVSNNRFDTMSLEDKSLTKTEQKVLLHETLASLKQSQKELDKKLNKIQLANEQNPSTKYKDIPQPNKQIDMDELTLLEMLMLSQTSDDFGPKSTEDTSKSAMSNNFEMYSEKDMSPQKSFFDETDFITRELIQQEKEQKTLVEMYMLEGEHVYELYSIMIHSGSAWGGHYYTYIKSFEDGQWYNFDDRNVTRMSVKEIEKVFGDDIPNKDNGSSAYMLKYRLLDRNEHKQGNEIAEIPETIKQLVDAERAEEIKRLEDERKRKEEREKEIVLRVFYNEAEQLITMRRDDTLESLVRLIQSELEIKEDPQNWRIRNYSVHENLMQEVLADKEQETQTLDQLKFKSYKALAVETRQPNEEWMEYDPSKMLIKINLWRPNLFDLEESVLKPQRLFVEEGITLRTLMGEIENKLKIPVNKQIAMKRNPYSGKGFTEVLNRDESLLDKDLLSLKVFNGLNLYVEEGTFKEGEHTKWDKEFEGEKHRCTIKFNTPSKDLEGQSPIYDNQIIIDNRKSILDLKQQIAEYLNIDMDSFLMKRNGKLGHELRELKVKLIDLNINGSVCVYILPGTPTKSGEYKIVFCLGTLQLENSDGLNFTYEDLFCMQISNTEKVLEIKERLTSKLAEHNPSIIVTPETIRLRERNALHPGQILHDKNSMKDYSLFDNKVIVVEKLDKPTTYDPSKILIYVRGLDNDRFELTAPKEIFIPKEKTTLHEVGIEACKVLDLPFDQVESLRVQSLYSFTKADLISNNWVTMDGNGHLVSSYPWYLTKDGYLLIIKRVEDKLDPEKVKGLKFINNRTTKAGESKFDLAKLMPKETSIKIKVKKRSDITKTQDDNDFKKTGESVIEKQKRPHEV